MVRQVAFRRIECRCWRICSTSGACRYERHCGIRRDALHDGRRSCIGHCGFPGGKADNKSSPFRWTSVASQGGLLGRTAQWPRSFPRSTAKQHFKCERADANRHAGTVSVAVHLFPASLLTNSSLGFTSRSLDQVMH